MALSADRNTQERCGHEYSFPILTATTIYAGSIVVLDASGYAKPAVTATGLVCAGMALETVVNAGASGAKNIRVRSGTFKFVNGDSITKAHIGDTAYLTDDETVAKLGTGKSPAGFIVDVEADGVWVHMTPALALTTVGLLAANNLADVGSAATARASLGLDTGDSPTFTGVTATTLTASGASKIKESVFATAANAYLVLNANGDQTVTASADNDVVTLPDAAAANKGLRVRVICTAADGGAKVSVSPDASDAIFGTIPNAAADSVASGVNNKDLILTKATQNKGDFVDLESDGTSGWYIVGGVGIFASEG